MNFKALTSLLLASSLMLGAPSFAADISVDLDGASAPKDSSSLILTGKSKAPAVPPELPKEMVKGAVTLPNGAIDEYEIATDPDQKPSGLLIVYLHGSGADFMEPFKVYELGGRRKPFEPAANIILRSDPGVVLVSPNYGGVTWGNDTSLAALDAVIHKVMSERKIQQVILFGSSMGASTALIYAAHAAPDIQARLLGVVAAQATSSFGELYKTTALSVLPPLMATALGAKLEDNPEIYKEKSPITNLPKIPKYCRLAFINAQFDTVVPYKLQTDLSEFATKKGYLTRVVNGRIGHGGQTPGDIRESIEWIIHKPKTQ